MNGNRVGSINASGHAPNIITQQNHKILKGLKFEWLMEVAKMHSYKRKY